MQLSDLMDKDIPVVILAGGLGLRMREYSALIPKALVPIGKMPVIYHVIKIYQAQGFSNFVVCLGYKGPMIKHYFKTAKSAKIRDLMKDVKITFVDTGMKTQTGGRLKKIQKYLDSDVFFLTYCDGVADIDLRKLLEFHLRKRKIATLTAIHPASPFGIVEQENGIITSFKEKPMLPGLINGGFFVFDKEIFNYLDDSSVLEEEVLRSLVKDRQATAYIHNGFWSCMDTYKDVSRLNKLWYTGILSGTSEKFRRPPWKIWK